MFSFYLTYLYLFNLNDYLLNSRNVYLTNDEKHVKLADLGTSRNLEDDTASLISTYCGTPLYMSPEMREFKEYSYNTDVWYFYLFKIN